jgi:hypothetical protein
MNESDVKRVAREMDEWFRTVLEACDQSLFSVGTTPQHRAAIVRSTLTHHARKIISNPIDRRGELYNSLALMLAALCRSLDLVPGPANWTAAVQGTLKLETSLEDAGVDALGLSLGGRAGLFKNLLDEALINSGVTDEPTHLSRKNQEKALALGINWGLRFLLAYALDTRPNGAPRRRRVRDLRWIRGLMESP